MLTTDITCADEFGRFLKITDDYSWDADEGWVISDEANIELEPFENLYTTIL